MSVHPLTLDLPLDRLHCAGRLSARARNALKWAGCSTLADVAMLRVEHLEALPNVGAGTVAEVLKVLRVHGMQPARPPAPPGDLSPLLQDLADSGDLPRPLARSLTAIGCITLAQVVAQFELLGFTPREEAVIRQLAASAGLRLMKAGYPPPRHRSRPAKGACRGSLNCDDRA